MDFSALGRTGTVFAMPIERGKVHEFAQAIRSTNPDYFTDRPVIPPTFLITQLFWQSWAGEDADPWRHVGIDLRRALHAAQEYEFFGPPPRAGTTLAAQSRIAEMFERTGRRGGRLSFGVMVTDFRDEDGNLVARARMTGVETQRPVPPPAADGPRTVGAEAPVPPDRADGPEPMVVGPLTSTDFVRYQGASGDFNPLHHDHVFARAAGYPQPIGIGLFGAGLVATYATDWLGAAAVRRFTIRFTGQVWAGDTLHCRGAIAGVAERAGEPLVEVEFACLRQTGHPALTVHAVFASGR